MTIIYIPEPSTFAYIIIHTRPDDTRAELAHMVTAYENITRHLNIQVRKGDTN